MRVQRVARGVVAFAKRRLEAFDLGGGFLQALVRELGRAVFAREFGDEALVLLGDVGSRGAKGSDLGGDVREVEDGGAEFRGGEGRDAGATQVVGSRGSRRR